MRIFARIAIALLSALLTVVALDRAVAFLDLAYTPAGGRKNEVRRLERAEFAVDVRLNALGFRERRLPSPKAPGVRRVVALGDSFTQGFGVEEDDAWPRRLEMVLDAHHPDRYQVVNLGVPGTNPRDQLSHLRDPGLAYEPDVVLVTVMANDVQERWVQREFDVRFASGVLVDARRGTVDPSRRGRASPGRCPGALPVRVEQASSPRRRSAARTGRELPPRRHGSGRHLSRPGRRPSRAAGAGRTLRPA